MWQYIIISVLFLAALAWLGITFYKQLSNKKVTCNKGCGCKETKTANL